MTINITEPVAQWLLDYDVKQLRPERRAYERRIAQAESLKQKLYRLDFNTKPLTLWSTFSPEYHFCRFSTRNEMPCWL